MSAKILASILVGVLLAGGAGYYYYSTVLNPQILELQATVEQLSEDYASLNEEFDTLTDEHEQLSQQLETLQGEYTSLSTDHETLTDEKEALEELYAQLESEYESLLSDYEAAFGGLDIYPESISVLEKLYTWEWDGTERSVSITVPEPLYDYYCEKERYVTTDYRVYVLHPYDDQYLEAFANEFKLIEIEEGLTEENVTDLVISFIQGMEYSLDQDSEQQGEYPKFPLETLVDGGGDCEDTSILAASLLNAMGHNVSLILLPNHLAVGLAVNATGVHWDVNGTDYYYLETTATGWDPGAVPSEHDTEQAELFPVEDEAFLVHEWTAQRVNEKVTVKATATNESPVKAEGYKVWVALEDRDEFIWAVKTSNTFDLEFDESKSVTVKITGPRFETLRLIVGIERPDGTVMSKWYSTFFTTR